MACLGTHSGRVGPDPRASLLSQRTRIVSTKTMLGLCPEFVRSLSSPTGEITTYSPWIYFALPKHGGMDEMTSQIFSGLAKAQVGRGARNVDVGEIRKQRHR